MKSIIKKLFEKQNDITSRTTYEIELDQAFKRTERFKLSCPDFKRTNQRFISEDKLHQLIEPLLNITQNLDIQSLIGQCITINLMIAGEVEQVFGLEPLLTIGWVELDNGEELFRVDENILLDNLTNRPETGSFNIHVWLTLPSLEIIDLTIMSTLGMAKHIPKIMGCVHTQDPNLKNGITYRPMLVGRDYLQGIGALRLQYFLM